MNAGEGDCVVVELLDQVQQVPQLARESIQLPHQDARDRAAIDELEQL